MRESVCDQFHEMSEQVMRKGRNVPESAALTRASSASAAMRSTRDRLIQL